MLSFVVANEQKEKILLKNIAPNRLGCGLAVENVSPDTLRALVPLPLVYLFIRNSEPDTSSSLVHLSH